MAPLDLLTQEWQPRKSAGRPFETILQSFTAQIGCVKLPGHPRPSNVAGGV